MAHALRGGKVAAVFNPEIVEIGYQTQDAYDFIFEDCPFLVDACDAQILHTFTVFGKPVQNLRIEALYASDLNLYFQSNHHFRSGFQSQL